MGRSTAFLCALLTLTAIETASLRAEIRIATAAPMSGPYAWSGEQYRLGSEMAVQDVNAAGGIPRIEGTASRQAHVDLPEGAFEQEIGRDGFSGPATHLYHSRPPTGWIEWDGPLRPRAFDTNRLDLLHGSLWDAELLLSNRDLKFRIWRCAEAMDHLVRNADGDELMFVHKGAGEIYCDFGRLQFRDGDYR